MRKVVHNEGPAQDRKLTLADSLVEAIYACLKEGKPINAVNLKQWLDFMDLKKTK